MSCISSVRILPGVIEKVGDFAGKFISSLKLQEQVYRVIALFESVLAILEKQSKLLGMNPMVGPISNARQVLGDAANCFVFAKIPGSIKNFAISLVNFNANEKKIETGVEKLAYDWATVIEDSAYVLVILNTMMLVQFASKTLRAFLFIANSAAVCYDVIDLKKSVVELTRLARKDQLSPAEIKHLEESKLLEVVKIAKTILHLAIDIIGIIAAISGLPLVSTTATLGIISIYLIGSMWTHVYSQSLVEAKKS
jgi:hypothetical protein